MNGRMSSFMTHSLLRCSFDVLVFTLHVYFHFFKKKFANVCLSYSIGIEKKREDPFNHQA